jgi:hypothetical protein
MYKKAICKVRNMGMAPLSFSKHYSVVKKPKELHEDYENRTWRERLHYDPKTGQVFIPGKMFMNSVKNAAKFASIQIPGKGKSTYTKHFNSGVVVMKDILLDVNKDNIEGETFFVPSDGVAGGGRRVMKTFPVIPEWEGSVEFIIMDPVIDEKVFTEVLRVAGQSIGIGRYRPQQGGYYGRFEVLSVSWHDSVKL